MEKNDEMLWQWSCAPVFYPKDGIVLIGVIRCLMGWIEDIRGAGLMLSRTVGTSGSIREGQLPHGYSNHFSARALGT